MTSRPMALVLGEKANPAGMISATTIADPPALVLVLVVTAEAPPADVDDAPPALALVPAVRVDAPPADVDAEAAPPADVEVEAAPPALALWLGTVRAIEAPPADVEADTAPPAEVEGSAPPALAAALALSGRL